MRGIHFFDFKLECSTVESTNPLVFGCCELSHVIFHKLTKKELLAKLSKFTRWQVFSLKMVLGCLFVVCVLHQFNFIYIYFQESNLFQTFMLVMISQLNIFMKTMMLFYFVWEPQDLEIYQLQIVNQQVHIFKLNLVHHMTTTNPEFWIF